MYTMKKWITAALSLTLILALAACSGNSDQREAPNLQQYYDDFMASLGEANAPAMVDTNEDSSYVDAFFPGLNDVELKQSVLHSAMISAMAFELYFVECANEDDVETVKSIFQARIDEQVNGGAFYPEATANWEKADLLVNGNIVALIVAGEYQDDAVNAFNALFD